MLRCFRKYYDDNYPVNCYCCCVLLLAAVGRLPIVIPFPLKYVTRSYTRCRMSHVQCPDHIAHISFNSWFLDELHPLRDKIFMYMYTMTTKSKTEKRAELIESITNLAWTLFVQPEHDQHTHYTNICIHDLICIIIITAIGSSIHSCGSVMLYAHT